MLGVGKLPVLLLFLFLSRWGPVHGTTPVAWLPIAERGAGHGVTLLS